MAALIIAFIFVLIAAAAIGYARKPVGKDPEPTPHASQDACDAAIVELGKLRTQECERLATYRDARDRASLTSTDAALAFGLVVALSVAAAVAATIPFIGAAIASALATSAGVASVRATYLAGVATAALDTANAAHFNYTKARAERSRAVADVTRLCPLDRATEANRLAPCGAE